MITALICSFAVQRASAQSVIITGTITNSTDKAALAGASILVKGSTSGVSTGPDGRFSISVPGTEVTLVVSHVGYQEQEIPLHGQKMLEIALAPANNQLGDVVVIGYGTVKKKDLTGSVAQVKPVELDAFPTGNVLQSLNGRASGVRVMQNDGTPGAPPSIRIRGTNSILGSNEPLYVIDGFPGTPNSLQANDIESVEILKDASATAIYGSRGSNGVVIITTRRGRAGKTRVDYEGTYGIQSPTKVLKLMNNSQWAQFYNLQATNDGIAPYFTNAQVDSIGQTKSTDWQREVLRQAPVSLHSLSVSGGDQKTQFSLSGNAFLQDGIISGSGYDRYTLHANVTHTISKIFSVNLNTLLSTELTNTMPTVPGNRGSTLINAMLSASPAIGPYNADGTLKRINTVYPWLSNVLINPLSVTREQTNKTTANRELANASFNIKPLDGLVFKFAGGIQNEDDRNDAFVQIDPVINSTGSAAVTTTQIKSLLSENTVSYDKTFGDHSISAVGGFTYQDYITTTLNASGTGFLSNQEQTYDLGGAATQGIATSSYSKWILFSWLGRINYAYKDRYLLTVSYRRDGSSKFSVLNKWADFPSAALAWRVSEEKFMKPINWISNLKLRTSYGAAGNNALNPYQTLNALGSSTAVFNDALYPAYGPTTTKPGALKWETTNSFDGGLDIGFFNNRVNFSADYYYKKTTNLLNTVQLPASTGYVNTLQNVGAIQNKGIELATDIQVLKGGPVTWNLNANIAFNRNRVTKLYGGQDIYGSVYYTGPINDFINLLRVGKPLGIFYGYVENGYTSTGNIQYKDLNKDGLINSSDKTYIGDPNPKFIYGFNTDVAWKGFDLSLFLQGSQGNDIFNVSASQTVDLGFALNEPENEFTDHWTPTHTNAKYPQVTKTITANISNRFVENGSYLRFKNIQLAYTLPQPVIKWARSIQVYVSGQNLITITKYSWYDPEINSQGSGNSINQGIDYSAYPTAKSITFGLRCGF